MKSLKKYSNFIIFYHPPDPNFLNFRILCFAMKIKGLKPFRQRLSVVTVRLKAELRTFRYAELMKFFDETSEVFVKRPRILTEKKMTHLNGDRGMRHFLLIWFGQQISLIGSGLTGFAMGVWVYQRTGSVTQFSLIAISNVLPDILFSPLAGVLADRWNRRRVMILSDSGAGLCTFAMAVLLFRGSLEIWHICVFNAVSSAFRAFQRPAFIAATTLLVAKEDLGRAGGMIFAADAVTQILSPVLAGLLIGIIEIQGIIAFDFATLLFALITLICVRIPDVPVCGGKEAGKVSLLQEAVCGWQYITARPGLLGLMIFFAVTSFFEETVIVLVTPLVLSFTSAAALGTIMSVSGMGMLAGSLFMSISGGPKRLIRAIFAFSLLAGLSILIVGFHRNIVLLAVSAFLYLFSIAIIGSCAQVIWQKKVAPSFQGRVIAIERMISTSCFPLSYLIAGPLADYIFEPLMAVNGPLAGTLGQTIGTGPGRGIALMFTVMGILSVSTIVIAYGYPRLRRLEEELADEV